MNRVILDTNLYIDWINRGAREEVMLGPGRIRYLSAVVVMELRAGAKTKSGRHAVDQLVRGYRVAERLLAPPASAFDRAGSVLRRLKLSGRELRSAAFVNDVHIALSARFVGASVITANVGDFEAIRDIEPFALLRA